MSNYTTQIRFICESKSGLTESTGFAGITEAIEGSVEQIFAFDWPIFDESYRIPLEVKILRHFYTREIGEETFGLWQLRLCDRLNVIMPYYNKLYESELIKFNPMWDVDLTTEHEKANDGYNNNNVNGVVNETDSNDRTLNKNEVTDGLSDTDYIGNKKNVSNVDQNESVDRDSIVDTSNVGIWDSQTYRSNIANGLSETESTKKNKNVNRYSDTPQGNVNIGSLDINNPSTSPTDGNVDSESVFGNGYLTNVTIVDDKTNREGIEKTQNTNDSSEEGKTIQDWTKQDKTKGKSDRVLSGLQEENANEHNTTKVNNSNVVDGVEVENIAGTKNVTNNTTSIGKNFSTEDFIQRVTGKRGGLTYSKMLEEFRKTFLNIDRMILNELDSLFIGLWE